MENSHPDALTLRYGPPAPFAEYHLGDLSVSVDDRGEITQGCISYIYVTAD